MNKLLVLFIVLTVAGLILARFSSAQSAKTGGRSVNPFGVLEFLYWDHDWNNHQYPDQASVRRSVKLMKEAGAGIVRMDFLWQDVEPQQGKWDFAKYDFIVDTLTRNGIEVLGLLNYCADWASPCNRWNVPSDDPKDFLAYARAVVSRYKGKVKYWEIWNEPDSAVYWANQDGLQSYIKLLKSVYPAIKAIDPDCKVLNGGLSAGISSVNKLYDNGAGGYFDILNLHIFETPLYPGSFKRAAAFPKLAYKIMERNADADKKIWITEVGCPGVRSGSSAKDWWMGKNPDEKQQAGWVKEVYAGLLADPNVERVFWAFFRDTNKHWDNGVDHFGLIRNDFSRKPSFEAYKKAAAFPRR